MESTALIYSVPHLNSIKHFQKGNQKKSFFNICPSAFYEKGTEVVMVFLAGYILISEMSVQHSPYATGEALHALG